MNELSILKKFTDFISKLSTIIKNNGFFNSILTILTLIILYILFYQPHIITNLLEKHMLSQKTEVDRVHEQGIKYREKMNNQIPLLLEQLIHKTNTDRGMLLEMHNGGSSIIGLPFLKASATYEVLSQRFVADTQQSYLIKDYKDEPVSLYNKLLDIIIKDKYLIVQDVENEGRELIGDYLYKRLMINGIKSAFYTGVFNVEDGSLIGLVVLTTDKVNVFNRVTLASEMISRIQVISYHLNVFNNEFR